MNCPRCRKKQADDALCAQCLAEVVKTWELANDHYNRRYYLLKKYKLTMELYAELMYRQNGQCAICDGPITKVGGCRWDNKQQNCLGLLCQRCNTALGYFHNDPGLLAKAAKYFIHKE